MSGFTIDDPTAEKPHFNSGERNGLAKLTDAAVREMRAQRERGVPTAKIAATYGVHPVTVFRAVRGESWRHVQ